MPNSAQEPVRLPVLAERADDIRGDHEPEEVASGRAHQSTRTPRSLNKCTTGARRPTTTEATTLSTASKPGAQREPCNGARRTPAGGRGTGPKRGRLTSAPSEIMRRTGPRGRGQRQRGQGESSTHPVHQESNNAECGASPASRRRPALARYSVQRGRRRSGTAECGDRAVPPGGRRQLLDAPTASPTTGSSRVFLDKTTAVEQVVALAKLAQRALEAVGEAVEVAPL